MENGDVVDDVGVQLQSIFYVFESSQFQDNSIFKSLTTKVVRENLILCEGKEKCSTKHDRHRKRILQNEIIKSDRNKAAINDSG